MISDFVRHTRVVEIVAWRPHLFEIDKDSEQNNVKVKS